MNFITNALSNESQCIERIEQRAINHWIIRSEPHTNGSSEGRHAYSSNPGPSIQCYAQSNEYFYPNRAISGRKWTSEHWHPPSQMVSESLHLPSICSSRSHIIQCYMIRISNNKNFTSFMRKLKISTYKKTKTYFRVIQTAHPYEDFQVFIANISVNNKIK